MTENSTTQPVGKKTALGIRTKLIFWMLFIALVPMVIISAASYLQSSKALEKQSFLSLESTRNLQKKGLEDYFTERTKNLRELNDTVHLLQNKVFEQLVSIRDLKKRELEKFLEEHLKLVRIFSSSPQQKAAVPIFASSERTAAEKKKYVQFYNNWAKDHEFASITLVDTAGRILYTSDKHLKAVRFLTKKKNSPESAAFHSGLKKASFTDFSESPLRKEGVVAYFSAPVIIGKRVEGVFLMSMAEDMIDSVLKGGSGLGENGDVYLVGRDRLFRSNSIYFEENIVANPAFLADTEAVDMAFEGRTGTRSILDFRGEYVLSAYAPVQFAGAEWAMLVEVGQVQAMAPKLAGQGGDVLASFADNYKLNDVFLITPDGFIFYSVTHKADYQTNILTGPYAGSGLSKVVDQVLEKKELSISDFEPYKPSDNLPASFMALPVMQEEEVGMVVAVQIHAGPVNEIMGQFGAQTKTGDSYIVGPDKLFRSDSLHPEIYNVKSTVLNPAVKVDIQPVQDALAGKSGTGITTNAAGKVVLASWAPFEFHGLHWALVNEIDKAEVFQSINKLFGLLTILALAGIAGAFLLSLLVSGGITRQIREIMQVINSVEEGDLESEAKVVSSDELGTMASAFNNMIGTTRELIETRQKEHDQLQDSIIGLLEEISALSEGDLTVRATVREDATGTVADSLNLMLNELSAAIAKIKHSSEEVGSTAQQLSSSTESLAESSDRQAEMISEVVEEINKMTKAIEEAAERARKSAETSELSRKAAIEGTSVVENTSRAMEAIRGNVQDTARAIKRLGESSQEISDFAKTINEISDRTSILALNASIQAAAAGEEGRGFAVVAEEIQRLAERAAGSTRQIETLIKNILGEITDAGASMDASIREVVEGTTLSEDALGKLQEINKRSTEVAELIDSVSTATSEQASGSVEVARTMDRIGVITTETAMETRSTSSSMKEMAELAGEMLASVSIFKLPETEEVLVTTGDEEPDDSLSLGDMLDNDAEEQGSDDELTLEALLEAEQDGNK
jgi:methyl-accepting chemotaxis protein